MFHNSPGPCARLGGTLLSRFRARAFLCLFCRTGFAASMPRAPFPGGRGRLSAVKVKLTMRLGIGAGLLVSAHSDARRLLGACSAKVGTGFAIGTRASYKLRAFSFGKPGARFAGKCSRAGAVVAQAVSNSLVVARGGVGMSPGFPARAQTREGFLGPPFFFVRGGILRRSRTLRCSTKPPNWAQSVA